MAAEIYKVDGSGYNTKSGCGANIFVEPPIPESKRREVEASLRVGARNANSAATVANVVHGSKMSSADVRQLHTGEEGTLGRSHLNEVAFEAAQLMVKALEDAGLNATAKRRS